MFKDYTGDDFDAAYVKHMVEEALPNESETARRCRVEVGTFSCK